MAKKRNLPLAMMGTPRMLPKPAPAPMPMMGGMMGKAPAAPMPKPKRRPVMKQKGVALSKFGPVAKTPLKKIKKAKMPMM